MQEIKFDVWSPVDSKNILSRLFWIVGSLVSLVLLVVSICVESAVLSVLDVILPIGIIGYGLIKHKKFPIYYYTTCLSALYPIIWLIITNNCDFSGETTETPSVIASVISVCVAVTVFLALGFFCVVPTKNSKINTPLKKAKIAFRFDRLILILSTLAILGSLFLNLNVICDKPYKTEWVYLQDIRYSRHDVDVFYTKQNSDIIYEVDAKDNKLISTHDWIEDWLYIDENGNKVFQIEYGNGALGIPWRHIVGNK